MAAYVYSFFYEPTLGLRIQGSSGLVFRMLEDEAGDRIYSDNGSTIRWWVRTGRQLLDERVSPRCWNTYVVNRLQGGTVSAGDLSLKWVMFDGLTGDSFREIQKPAATAGAAPPVPETIQQKTFKPVSGFDLEVWVGARNSAQRIDVLTFEAEGTGSARKQ